jgi:hypothetical protein
MQVRANVTVARHAQAPSTARALPGAPAPRAGPADWVLYVDLDAYPAPKVSSIDAERA